MLKANDAFIGQSRQLRGDCRPELFPTLSFRDKGANPVPMTIGHATSPRQGMRKQ